MRSSFKRIGEYVQQVNARNTGLSVTNLQGVSINKYFMPSVANVTGTDLSTYKVVCKDQFAFNPMHVGRDEVLPIAMLDTDVPVIVSPAYAVFEIIDKKVLLPEYLMMWCRRPEFDRNAWFTTDSSVRGGFNWDDFCEMTLPVPSPEKQREIVKEYHTIVDRIKLNERLNQKLEETAQAIYKQWFVDFEFPISAEYAASIGKPELAGQPYKSSGGEMVFNEVLKQEIPKGWETVAYTEMFSLCGGGTPKTEVDEYWNGNIPFFTPKDTGSSYYSVDTEKSITELGLKNSSTKLYKKDTVFITARGTVGELALASKPMAMNQSCYAALMKSYNAQYFAHQHSLNALKSLTNEANGGVFGALVTRDFDGCMVINPKECICKYNKVAKNVYQMILNVQNETSLLNKLQNLLLAGIAKGEIF
jgi:type I restriction enzyme S subunit